MSYDLFVLFFYFKKETARIKSLVAVMGLSGVKFGL